MPAVVGAIALVLDGRDVLAIAAKAVAEAEGALSPTPELRTSHAAPHRTAFDFRGRRGTSANSASRVSSHSFALDPSQIGEGFNNCGVAA
jgi:F420-0:gamma-glutamyl ligase